MPDFSPAEETMNNRIFTDACMNQSAMSQRPGQGAGLFVVASVMYSGMSYISASFGIADTDTGKFPPNRSRI